MPKRAATPAGATGAESWIRVEDRLPELGKLVLVFDGDDWNQIYVGHFTFRVGSRIWEDYRGHRLHGVTHWMLLPETPHAK